MSEVKELLSKGANVNYHNPEKGLWKVNSMRNCYLILWLHPLYE